MTAAHIVVFAWVGLIALYVAGRVYQIFTKED